MVLKAPIRLSTLNQSAKVLIAVDAVNLLRNFLVRTYQVGGKCQKKGQAEKLHLRRVYDSLYALISELSLNLIELCKESRKTLSRYERHER